MDATLIAVSPSTKNKSGKRDAQMSQSKKGNQWYFGMKALIGVDGCRVGGDDVSLVEVSIYKTNRRRDPN